MSQGRLAELIGIHPVTLSRLETGTAPLTEEMRGRITKALDKLEK